MQQQICPPDPMGYMDPSQHQVMLCPVRLVYETQILLQPGDQMQPNQTMFINSQNPPPWIQNRPHNQVIYMQPMPNNMMPNNMMQPMPPILTEQSQLYIPNYPPYPPQMMQIDQMRQMPNVMTQNMIGMGPNVGHAMPNIGPGLQNVGQSMQNVGMNQNMPMGNVNAQNMQKPMPNFTTTQNVANDRVAYNTAPNATNNTMGMANNQATANGNPTMPERPQMNQNLGNMQRTSEIQVLKQQILRPPQVSVSPMPNAKFGSNVDVRPITVTPRPQNNDPNMNLGPNNVQANVIAKKVPLPNRASPGVLANQIRNHNQTYFRPIQPRPMGVMPMGQNQYIPMQSSNPAPRPHTQINADLNRKRKSESPDDTRKKLPIIGNNDNTNQTGIRNQPIHASIQKNTQYICPHNQIYDIEQSEIGVNTKPVKRPIKPVKNVMTASTGTQANIAKEKPQIEKLNKSLEIKALPAIVNDNLFITLRPENDKLLLRNTVFTQARGLLRSEPHILQPDIISIEKIPLVAPKKINVIETIAQPTTFEDYSIEIIENVMETVNNENETGTDPNGAPKKDIQVEIVITRNVMNNVEDETLIMDLPDLDSFTPTITNTNEEVKAKIKTGTEIPYAEIKMGTETPQSEIIMGTEIPYAEIKMGTEIPKAEIKIGIETLKAEIKKRTERAKAEIKMGTETPKAEIKMRTETRNAEIKMGTETPKVEINMRTETRNAEIKMGTETPKAEIKMRTETRNAEIKMGTETPKVEINMRTETPKAVIKMGTETRKAVIKMGTETPKAVIKMGTETPKVEINMRKETPKADIKMRTETPKAEIKMGTETPKAEIKMGTETPKPKTKGKKRAKKETKEPKEESKKVTVTSISDFQGNELQIAEGSVQKKRTDSYILTHVLDGYVIQESNMAFPVRKPLKEKMIYQNSDLATEQKREDYKHRNEDGKVIQDNSRILVITDLNLSEDDKIKEDDNSEATSTATSKERSEDKCGKKNEKESEQKCEEKSEKSEETFDDNPFKNLTAGIIKAWTASQLTAHLSKYNWSESISALAEHEIDGESLFLVSQPQLVQIGVTEAHADIICEFINA